MTEIPYTHDNLGEENYAPERGGPVDRQIDNQEAHVGFYDEATAPKPYPA